MNVHRSRRHARGFTLIELLVAVAILGILATIAIQEIWGYIDQAKVTGTETKLQSLHTVVQQYKIKNLRLPRELSDLIEPDPRNLGRAWIEDEDALRDSWGNLMEVRETETGGFEIISFGEDGTEGGENLDMDLSSRKSSQAPNNTDR